MWKDLKGKYRRSLLVRAFAQARLRIHRLPCEFEMYGHWFEAERDGEFLILKTPDGSVYRDQAFVPYGKRFRRKKPIDL